MFLQLVNNFTGIICAIGIFMYLMFQIEKADPKSGLHIYSKKDGFIFFVQIILSNFIINYRLPNLFDRIFFMLMIGIMVIHTYTDKKTKTVYRPFNYCLWIIGSIYCFIKLVILKQFPPFDEGPEYTFLYILIFIAIMYAFTFILKASGKGDGYMLIGLSFFIPFLADGTMFISLVIMLLYYIIAGIFQIITNITKFDIKKFKFKEKLPFAPALFYGIWIILVLTKFFATPNFQIWQLEHLIF